MIQFNELPKEVRHFPVARLRQLSRECYEVPLGEQRVVLRINRNGRIQAVGGAR